MKAYERIRLPHVNNVLQTSAKTGALYEQRSVSSDDSAAWTAALEGLYEWVAKEDPPNLLDNILQIIQSDGASSKSSEL